MARRGISDAAVLLACVLLAGCAARDRPTQLHVVDIHATSAAVPWLEAAYDCAPPNVALRLSSPASADVSLRLGEPSRLALPAYQVGVAEILVIVHPLNAVRTLSLAEVQAMFGGRISNWGELGGAELPVQVWVYPSGEDLQLYLDRSVMKAQPVTSLARLAPSAQAMSDSVGSLPGSIGFLPKRWKAGNTTEALTLPALPVLAVAKSVPMGDVGALLSCMQSQSEGDAP